MTATAHELYHAMARLSRHMHRLEHRMAHESLVYGRRLHRGQSLLLSLISKKNGASQGELCEEMDVRPSSMTEILLKMERAGLIVRKQDEKDQRVMRVFLTDAGEKAASQSDVADLDLTTTIFNCLTMEEQTQMLTLIQKISASVETMDRPDGHDDHHGRHGRQSFHGHHRMHHLSFHGEYHDPCYDRF